MWQPEVPRDRSLAPRLPGGVLAPWRGVGPSLSPQVWAPCRLRSAPARDPFCIKAGDSAGWLEPRAPRWGTEQGRGVGESGQHPGGRLNQQSPAAQEPAAWAACPRLSLLSLPLLCPPQTSDMPQDLVNDLGSDSTRPTLQRPLGVPGPASAPGLPGGPGGLVVWEATATSQAGPARPSLGAPRSQRHMFSCELSFSLLLSFNFKSHGPAVPPLPTHPFLSLCRQRSLRAGGSA